MTVYVDEIRTKAGRGAVARLIADTDRELDQMAGRLGLSFYWFCGRHYEVSRAAQAKAIRLGAQLIPRRQLAALLALRRRSEPLGAPGDALERLAALLRFRRDLRAAGFADPRNLTQSGRRAQDSAANDSRRGP